MMSCFEASVLMAIIYTLCRKYLVLIVLAGLFQSNAGAKLFEVFYDSGCYVAQAYCIEMHQ